MILNPADKSTVVSIFPLKLVEYKPGIYPGKFIIPESPNGDPVLVVIGQSIHYVDVGADRPLLAVPIASSILAKSIVDDYITSQPCVEEDSSPGLFWITGEVTLQELKSKYSKEVEAAKARQTRWYMKLVQLADDDWAKYGRHNVISEIQRIAARKLGYTDRPWLVSEETIKTLKCPACGISVSTSVVVCPNCRCVLDKKKYSELQFVGG